MARELVKTISRGKKNQFLNSDFKIAQRTGGNTTPITAVGYFADRWRSDGNLNTGFNHVVSSLPSGFPGNDRITRAARLFGTVTDPTSSAVHQQRVESIRALEMGSNIISTGIWVYGNNFQEVRIVIIIPTAGVDDYSTNSIIADVTTPITDDTWQFISVENVDLGDRSNGYLVDFSFQNPSNTTGAFDTYMTQAMCNEGPVVEPWSLAEGSFDLEFRACQRYYEQSQDTGGGNANSGLPPTWTMGRTNGLFTMDTYTATGSERWIATAIFNTEKRATPDITIRDRAGNLNRITLLNISGGTQLDNQTYNSFSAGTKGVSLRSNAANTYVFTNKGGFGAAWTADAEL